MRATRTSGSEVPRPASLLRPRKPEDQRACPQAEEGLRGHLSIVVPESDEVGKGRGGARVSQPTFRFRGHECPLQPPNDGDVERGAGEQLPAFHGLDEAPKDLGRLPGGLAGWGGKRCHCSIVVGGEGGAVEPRAMVDSLRAT